MSSQIDTNGLFSEAAYGPDGPQGLSGVTGSGESHEAAWKQALVQAKSLLVEGTPPPIETGSHAAFADASDTALAPPTQTVVKADNPLSWDRLSMTVASMVAWNMSVELADDVAASPLAENDVSANALVQEAKAPAGQELLDSADTPTMVPAKTMDQKVDRLGSFEGPTPSDVTEDDTGFDDAALFSGSDPEPDSESGAHIPLEQTFREGTRDLNARASMRDGSTGLSNAEPQGLAIAQQGTTPSNASQPIMMSVTNAGMSEIPSSTTASGIPEAPGGLPAEAQQLDSAAVDRSKTLDSIIRVRSSSALPLDARLGQERLEGIRSVLAELETQATVRNTVADLVRAPRPESIRPEPMTGFVGAGGIADQAVSKQGAAAVQSNPMDKPTLKPAPNSNDADGEQTYGRVQSSGFEPGSTREQSPPSKRPLSNLVARPAGGEPSPDANGQAATAMTTPFEAVVGAENSKIASDQEAMVEILEVDGSTIEANEVPELAVQDISHLDIDVDDPMGPVRVAMTREAEEVSIRMETPAEVLEEYREMEEEMAEAMASQGLDLSNFSADAQGFGEDADDASRGATARTTSESEMSQAEGEQPLKQSGSVSRLVNRIV